MCDFNDFYSCGYQMSGAGRAVTGQTRGTAYGPAFDHTTGDATGKYYFFHKPANSRGLVSSSVTIPNLGLAGGMNPHCLKFYYQINTPSTSSFYVYVMPNKQVNPGSDQTRLDRTVQQLHAVDQRTGHCLCHIPAQDHVRYGVRRYHSRQLIHSH